MEVDLPEAEADSSGGLEVVSKTKKPTFRVFTTRIDTIYGMTFCVLAPEHPLLAKIKTTVSEEKTDEITAYQQKARETSDIDRQAVNRTKTGVNTGVLAINPATGKGVPVFIADYVLMGYGTGAIMAVPGHDERDFEFAQTFGLDVIPVITEVENRQPESLPYPAKDGWLINSGSYTAMTVKDAQTALGEWVESIEIGERMGENDRSASGFLPPAEFEQVADQFFAAPDSSARGWATARAEQARIVAAIHAVLLGHRGGDILFVGHGAVGALNLCHLLGEPISRSRDQPGGGGNIYAWDIATKRILHPWRSIEQEAGGAP